MDPLSSAFLAFAKEARVDLVGVAPVERFDDVAADHHPRSIFPDTRSVVVIGKRITRGTLRGVEEGTQFDIYGQYGLAWLKDRMLAVATITLATWLEDHRWEACPIQDLDARIPPVRRSGQARLAGAQRDDRRARGRRPRRPGRDRLLR